MNKTYWTYSKGSSKKSNSFSKLQKKFFFLSDSILTPPPFYGRANKKNNFFCGFPKDTRFKHASTVCSKLQ